MSNKILIVEDELILREAYAIVLKSAGFKVVLANDGKEALSKIQKNEYNLILLDLLMPNLDGWGFLKKANIKKKWPNTKIIIFSNLSSIEKINDALNLGADFHVIKANTTPKQLISLARDQLQTP